MKQWQQRTQKRQDHKKHQSKFAFKRQHSKAYQNVCTLHAEPLRNRVATCFDLSAIWSRGTWGAQYFQTTLRCLSVWMVLNRTDRLDLVKMAPLMAAFMVSSAVVFMFLLVCPVFSYIPAISFTRDELLNIWKNTPPDILPDFVYSDVLLDIVVGGAAVLFRHFRTHRWGKQADALMKLR